MENLRADDKLGHVVERYGELDLTPADDPFGRLVVAVLNQQLSKESAAAIENRLFEKFDVTPSSLLDTERDELRQIGISGPKIEYIREIARAFQSGEISTEKLEKWSNEEVVDHLTEIKGIGTWTAKMFLLSVLAREDVFPVEDLGIRRGMKRLFGDISREQMVEEAERWAPKRSYASLYLWKLAHEED